MLHPHNMQKQATGRVPCLWLQGFKEILLRCCERDRVLEPSCNGLRLQLPRHKVADALLLASKLLPGAADLRQSNGAVGHQLKAVTLVDREEPMARTGLQEQMHHTRRDRTVNVAVADHRRQQERVHVGAQTQIAWTEHLEHVVAADTCIGLLCDEALRQLHHRRHRRLRVAHGVAHEAQPTRQHHAVALQRLQLVHRHAAALHDAGQRRRPPALVQAHGLGVVADAVDRHEQDREARGEQAVVHDAQERRKPRDVDHATVYGGKPGEAQAKRTAGEHEHQGGVEVEVEVRRPGRDLVLEHLEWALSLVDDVD